MPSLEVYTCPYLSKNQEEVAVLFYSFESSTKCFASQAALFLSPCSMFVCLMVLLEIGLLVLVIGLLMALAVVEVRTILMLMLLL